MLAEILKDKGVHLQFTMLEIGAVPLGEGEPFHRLLEAFPGSRVLAFEVDEIECSKLNDKAPPGMKFYAQALGRTEETRTFFVAAAPMCSSLYPPNQPFCDLFHNLGHLVRTVRTVDMHTVSLDHFVRQAGLECIDFIKIDVQGAELDIFRGAEIALKNVSAIVAEVEFIPLYREQPLFEDVSAYLRTKGFSFQKFLGMAGRSLLPIIFNGNVNFPQQHLWSDALFAPHLLDLDRRSDEALFKLAVLMECYGSCDVSHFVLTILDKRRSTDFAALYLQSLLGRHR